MNAAPPRVGLVVDHPKRDLPGCVLLAHELAKRGSDCFLVPQYEQGIDVPLLGLDMLVVNYARAVNLDLVRTFAGMGVAVYVLDTEGGVLAEEGPNTPERLAAYVRSSGYGDLLAGYFFWGTVLHGAFLRDGAMSPERLHLTGCPRFDFAAPSMRALRALPRQGHVLVNTNYPAVNPRFTGRSRDDRQALSSVGYADDYIERMLEDTRAIMRGMIETVRRLATDWPNQRFVLRPHPFENEGIYRDAFAGLSNVEVDGTGNVIDALNGAKALLHLNCGTAIEAIMLSVTPYSLEFLNTEHMSNHASLPSRASFQVRSYEELGALLAKGAGEVEFDFVGRHARLVEPYFHRNDGQAAARVADVLVRDGTRFGGRRRAARSLRRSLLASRPSPRPAQIAQSVVANLLGSQATSALRAYIQTSRRDKALSPAAAGALLTSLADHDRARGARVCRATHPLTGLPLSSLHVRAAAAEVPRR